MTEKDLLRAIENADKAGDTEAAQELVNAYKNIFSKKEEQAPQAPQDPREAKLAEVTDVSDMVPDKDDPKRNVAGTALFEGATLGHAAEITAGVETVSDILSGEMTPGSFGASYIGKRNKYENILEEMEEKYPVQYNMFNLAGAITTAPSTITKGVAYGAAAGFGYSKPKKKSELMTVDESVKGMLEGAAYEGIGVAAGGMIGSKLKLKEGSEKLGSMYHEYMAGSLAEALGQVGKWKQRLSKGLRKQGRSMTEWADNLMDLKSKKGDNLINAGQSYDETYDKVIQFKEEIGEDIGRIIEDVSEKSGKISGESIFSTVKRSHLDKKLQSNHAPTVEKAKRYEKQLKDSLFTEETSTISKKGVKGDIETTTETKLIPKELTLREVQSLKKTIGSTLIDGQGKRRIVNNSADQSQLAFNNKWVGSLTGIIDDAVLNTKAVKESEELYNVFKGLKNNYGDLVTVEEGLSKTIDKMDAPGFLTGIRDMLNYRGMVAAGIGRTLGLGDKTAITVGIGFNKMVSNPGTPTAMTVQLKKISEALLNNPDKYDNVVKKLAAAGTSSNMALGETFSEVNSTVNLMDDPLPRSTEALLGRRDDLLTVLYGNGKDELAAKLTEALNNGDTSTAGMIANDLAKDPAFTEMFQAGIGWDGRATTDEERQNIESQIKSKFSLKMQSELLTKFRADSMIPNLEEEEIKEDFIYEKAKDKAKNKPY